MPIARICAMAAKAADRRRRLAAAVLGLAALLAGCAAPPAPPPTAAAPPPVGLPLQQAVTDLAAALVAHAQLPPPPASGHYPIAIDPWIDSTTGYQVATTRLMQAEIETLAPQHFPQLQLLPFTTASLARKPVVLLGFIAPVSGPGSVSSPAGNSGAYLIRGVLADLGTGRIISAQSAWVRPEDVNVTPLAAFRDSPAWLPDDSMGAYLRTAAARPGDPIDPAYLRNLQAEALLADATTDYDDGRYAPALDLYRQAAELPEGHQLRVYNGLYLTNLSLGNRQAAAANFARLVDYGLRHGYLGVKFLFQTGATAFWPDPAISGPYPMWLDAIALRADADGACLRIVGHASPSGPAELNDRLSLARARRIERDLVNIDPGLPGRLSVRGEGARNPIVGTGTNDATDVLDRRVDFRPLPCPPRLAENG